MAKKAVTPRTVQCYLCRHRFEVSTRAQSTSCPGCHKPIMVEDFILKKNKPSLLMVTKVQTCGKIVIPKRARIVADLVEAHDGIKVLGHMEAHKVLSGRVVVIGRKGHWRGDLKAPAVVIEDQAVLHRSLLQVPDDSLGLSDLPGRPKSK